jgi:hypothetical protein
VPDYAVVGGVPATYSRMTFAGSGWAAPAG